MNEPVGVALSRRNERRYRRFKLRYPVHLLFQAGEVVSEVKAVSRNISTGGLLLESPVLLPQNSAISFVISLSGRKFRAVRLAGEGTVVRVELNRGKMDFAIAVECKTPITQIEPYLPISN